LHCQVNSQYWLMLSWEESSHLLFCMVIIMTIIMSLCNSMIIVYIWYLSDIKGGVKKIGHVWTENCWEATAADSKRPVCWTDSGLLTCPVLLQSIRFLFHQSHSWWSCVQFGWLSRRFHLPHGKFNRFTQTVSQEVTIQYYSPFSQCPKTWWPLQRHYHWNPCLHKRGETNALL